MENAWLLAYDKWICGAACVLGWMESRASFKTHSLLSFKAAPLFIKSVVLRPKSETTSVN